MNGLRGLTSILGEREMDLVIFSEWLSRGL